MLTEEQLNILRKKYEENKNNKVKERIFNNNPLIALIYDSEIKQFDEFNIEIDTHEVYNQYSTGRCWIMSGLNILRERVIDLLELPDFKLSANYIAFYDKLERFNYSLEMIIKHKNKGLYSNKISTLLWRGIEDEGYFTRLA